MTGPYHFELPYGAEPVSSGRIRYRVWAPSCTAVSVVLEHGDVAMDAEADGWFAVECDGLVGTRYRYRFAMADGGTLVAPDPASRSQDGDVHDASVVVDPKAYHWRHPQWNGRAWCETVLYELHVGLCGGFAGVQRMLPDLAQLGITAIELMPIADFVGPRNWGYDGVLPYAPDASYGSPDELKSLIDAAHGIGLMVFLDVVYNHFGPDGNFIGSYADAFFRDDVQTPWGRAIDFRRAEVREFFSNNALYWLDEYRIDGLRLDATHSIVPQDWLADLARDVVHRIQSETPGRRTHLVIEHEGNAAHLLGADRGFDAQWNDDFHHVMHVLLTGETAGYYVDFSQAPADALARCLSEGFVYQGQPSVFRQGEPRGEPSKDLPPTAFVSFLQNHDQVGNRAFGERLRTLVDPAALDAAYTMLLLCPQIPLLFMGEEHGATEPFLYFTSYPDPDLARAIREGRQREFAGGHGFSDPTLHDTIPDPNDASTFERSRAKPDGDGAVRQRMRALLAARAEHIAPRIDGARSLGAEAVGSAAVVARWHMGDGAVLGIAANFSSEPVEVHPHHFHLRGDLIATTPEPAVAPPSGHLPGYATWVFLEGAVR